MDADTQCIDGTVIQECERRGSVKVAERLRKLGPTQFSPEMVP
jgi:hypothetical protein